MTRRLAIFVALSFAAALLVALPADAQITVPDTIAADCSADEHAELQAFLDAIPDGSTVQLGAGACYLSEQSLFLTANNVRVEGNGATLRADTDGSHLPAWDGKEVNWPRQRLHLCVCSSANVTVTDLNVDGPNAEARYDVTREAQHGVEVARSTNVLLDDVDVTDVWGDFVSIVGGSSIVTIDNANLSGAGRQGLGIDQGSDVLFEDFHMTRVARSAVDVEPQLTWEVHRVTVRNGTFAAPIANAIFANFGTGAAVTDVRFVNTVTVGRHFNVLNDNDTPGERERFYFVANTATGTVNRAPTYRFTNATHVIVELNGQPFAGKDVHLTGAAVQFRDGTCGRVRNNTFPWTYNGQSGVMTESSGVTPCHPKTDVAVQATPATGASNG